VQGIAAAQAGVSVIQPNVGRTRDWYNKHPGVIRDPHVRPRRGRAALSVLSVGREEPCALRAGREWRRAPARCARGGGRLNPAPLPHCRCYQGPREDSGFASRVDPGLQLVRRLYGYVKARHPKTQIMASGIRTKDGACVGEGGGGGAPRRGPRRRRAPNC
jgi:hypothetical protein